MNESRLRDLNLSTDEISRLERAFSDQKFKDLFGEYLREIHDPENQKTFENEILELERQQGNDIIFLKPSPNHVLKTSIQGSTKAYINVSSSINVNRLNYEPVKQGSTCGVEVSIPYSLSPVQKGLDKKNNSCFIYTVAFHPDTLKDAANNVELTRAVEETIFSAIEKSFNVVLDRVNYKKSKKTSKGSLQMTIIRKNGVTNAERDVFASSEVKQLTLSTGIKNDYEEPKYKIKYRNEVDLQNSTNGKYCKLDILIPKQIVVEVQLPLLKSIQHTKLDVKSTSVTLVNENPKYKLHLALPYEVCEEAGTAKFDSDSHILTLELLVKKMAKENSKPANSRKLVTELCENVEPKEVPVNGCDPSVASVDIPSEHLNGALSSRENGRKENADETFLNPNIKYKFPSYSCNYFQSRLAFAVNVKNVDRNSFQHWIFEDRTGFCIKFSSLGSGHFPMYYAMCVVFPEGIIETMKSLDFSIDNERLFVYLHLREGAVPLEYFVGVDRQHTEKAYLNESEAVHLEIRDKKPETLNVDIRVSEFNSERVVINLKTSKGNSSSTNGSCNTASQVRKSSSTVNHNGVRLTNGTDKSKKEKFPKKEQSSSVDLENLQKVNFTAFCNRFKTQFLLDEETHSESELIFHRAGSPRDSHLETNSDVENRSWIVETKSAKKARRKKKAREKKSTEESAANGVQDAGSVATERADEVEEGANTSEDCAAVSLPIDIRSAYKYSDMSSRSILKKSRSFSESSGDELFYMECSRSYSIDDINFSSDSYNHSGPKKTVTFNDVISKKLYSSDISILEQRKRSRRRGQRKDRRASDSENSETEGAGVGDMRSDSIRAYNETLFSETSETDLTSLSESGGETSDDQSDNPDSERPSKNKDVPCSKKNHKRRGKKSARKNASMVKHHYHADH